MSSQNERENELEQLILLDRQWISGAMCGFNLGLGYDYHGLNDVIEARTREIKASKK